jgi:hypothetical protein
MLNMNRTNEHNLIIIQKGIIYLKIQYLSYYVRRFCYEAANFIEKCISEQSASPYFKARAGFETYQAMQKHVEYYINGLGEIKRSFPD